MCGRIDSPREAPTARAANERPPGRRVQGDNNYLGTEPFIPAGRAIHFARLPLRANQFQTRSIAHSPGQPAYSVVVTVAVDAGG